MAEMTSMQRFQKYAWQNLYKVDIVERSHLCAHTHIYCVSIWDQWVEKSPENTLDEQQQQQQLQDPEKEKREKEKKQKKKKKHENKRSNRNLGLESVSQNCSHRMR